MKNLYVFVVFVCLIFSGCGKSLLCGESKGLEHSSLGIYAYHTGLGEYFYPEIEYRSPFKRDSLQVFDNDGRRLERIRFLLNSDPVNPLNRFYSISIAPSFRVPQDNDAFGVEKNTNIYLKYNHNTTDTLSLVFKAYKNKCDRGEYEYLKIYHRGNLIHSVTKEIYAVFKLNH
jgi:hypothetical protein